MRLLVVIVLSISIGIGEACRCRYGCCRRYPFLNMNACCKRSEECVLVHGYGTCTPKNIVDMVRPIIEIIPTTEKDMDPEIQQKISNLFQDQTIGFKGETREEDELMNLFSTFQSQ